MTFWKANHRQKQARWAPGTIVHRRVFPTIRAPSLQWSVAAAMGLILGLYLLVAISWRPRWAPFFVLAAFLPFVAMILGDVRKLLLGIILLEIPFPLDVHLLFDRQAVAINAIGGLNISITTFCLAILYALWLAELLAKTTTVPHTLRAGLPLLAYFAVVTLSIVIAQNALLAVFEIFLLLQSFLLFVYIVKWVQNRNDLLFVVTMLLIGLAIESFLIIGVRIIGHNVSVAHITARIDANLRVGGTLGNPNTAGGYLALLSATCLGVLLTPLKRRYKFLAGLAFGLSSMALVLTFSRGGWVTFAISVTLFCLLAYFWGRLNLRVILIIAVIDVLVFLIFGDAILTRLFGDDKGAAYSRIEMMELAIRMIKDYPLIGVGSNNFGIMLKNYITPEFYNKKLHTVHNKYLLVWAETGIIGLVAFLVFLLSVVRQGWLTWKLDDRFLSPIALGFTVAVVGQMAHMSVDLFHNRSQVQLFWLVAGFITAMRYLKPQDNQRSHKIR